MFFCVYLFDRNYLFLGLISPLLDGLGAVWGLQESSRGTGISKTQRILQFRDKNKFWNYVNLGLSPGSATDKFYECETDILNMSSYFWNRDNNTFPKDSCEHYIRKWALNNYVNIVHVMFGELMNALVR